ncbi:NUDIX hydrolase [Methylocystis heyeri]|uniref:NUDIX domain-containing protein n=1 Tax=Methylocystis heyeri TaxID=391905 RepID=A0A6B8KJ31_9HYPH|nr:NUDIX hydrolase [Methylocystis heyeri]QGM47061.1 NUDIX domain-containing protein [Methylocystis heyeri]
MTKDALRPWKADSSRVLVDSPWIRLRAERCVTQRGAVLDPFYLLDYPEWVHVAAFDDEDRLLLVRQYRHGARRMTLELPGGMMDPGEDDPLAAGARELLEETGHVAETLAHLARLSPNPSSHTNGLHILLATGVKRRGELSLDATEDVVVEPTPWREAVRMAIAGEMIHAQHVGLLFIALARAKGLEFAGK